MKIEDKIYSILIIDDDPNVILGLTNLLEDDYNIKSATNSEVGISLLEKNKFDAVILDIKLPGKNGLESARIIRNHDPLLPVIFYTAFPGEFSEKEIDKNEKPFDYIVKGEAEDRLCRSLANAIENHRLKKDNYELSRFAEVNFNMIGNSPIMRSVFEKVRQAATCDIKIMILGETGTGKELIARAIHKNSSRAAKSLSIMNCNYKSPELIEAELFGVEKHTFTNVRERTGLFEYADGGTLFLDEIGDLDISTQAKLLRAIEYGEYQKLGDPEIRKTDTRVLCATHHNLLRMTKEGTFREDLYHRLKGFEILIPPLRDRKEDIPSLVENFNQTYTHKKGLPAKIFDNSAINLMLLHHWPGNVRELQNVVISTIEFTNSDFILDKDVANFIDENVQSVSKPKKLEAMVNDYKKTIIQKALIDNNWHINNTAEELGVDQSTLYRYMKDLDIKRPPK